MTNVDVVVEYWGPNTKQAGYCHRDMPAPAPARDPWHVQATWHGWHHGGRAAAGASRMLWLYRRAPCQTWIRTAPAPSWRLGAAPSSRLTSLRHSETVVAGRRCCVAPTSDAILSNVMNSASERVRDDHTPSTLHTNSCFLQRMVWCQSLTVFECVFLRKVQPSLITPLPLMTS